MFSFPKLFLDKSKCVKFSNILYLEPIWDKGSIVFKLFSDNVNLTKLTSLLIFFNILAKNLIFLKFCFSILISKNFVSENSIDILFFFGKSFTFLIILASIIFL